MSTPPDAKTRPSRTINQNPDAMPPLSKAIPLGLQHIMAMFAGNVTPPIIIAGVIGANPAEQIFLIQVALFVAGVSTLVQTIGIGPIGARLPIVQGTSFGFLPVALPLAKAFGLPAVLGASFVAGLLQIVLGAFLKKIRHWFSPVVTGIVVLLIGITLMPVGLNYAAGGVGADDFASPSNLLLALFVLSVTIAVHQYGRGFIKASSILFGLLAGYIVAIALGIVDFTSLSNAAWFALPKPLEYGMTFSGTAIIGMTLIMFVVGLETIGNISAITTTGAGRPAKDRELSGGVMADGVATSLAAVFNTLPNTAYAQNVGLITLTGVVSRHVVTIGGLLLIAMGLFPKLGGLVAAMPPAVLGGAGVVMFGMIASAGLKIIKECELDQRNMLIIAVSLSLGIGLPAVEAISETMPGQLGLLLKSGLVPAALAALLLDAILPGKPDRRAKLAKAEAEYQNR
ncbi:purine permease [Vreelandella titanicae]|uniref:Xanthine permease n=1 Tax=Vreelandella titanicae BH1 TaxID=1204738 RepID=L9U994_9GAMM|nr:MULTISPECIES: nucleobase:cation symporter-2 family protein [Halomonas]NAO95732.1 purine permease [Halomonas sp. MG34]ELY21404.1 Xanthine permease [Halomonas titanicae BH1]KIN14137.1 uracil permease [Halomonas sp. KHS3]MCD1585256.1 purine permease [Halomonas sp. IOP_14]NVE91853.1 purine permease [Halomonas titanicae]|tara:strand:- start:523 stop:1890 length:1368 start_codon:yes stop_codon:yes gene_type:complete